MPCRPSTRLESFTAAGGLISYGSSFQDSTGWRASTPVDPQGRKAQRSAGRAATKFDLVINLRTARALGLEIPPTLLARADEVIE